jgi:hypothetical protein
LIVGNKLDGLPPDPVSGSVPAGEVAVPRVLGGSPAPSPLVPSPAGRVVPTGLVDPVPEPCGWPPPDGWPCPGWPLGGGELGCVGAGVGDGDGDVGGGGGGTTVNEAIADTEPGEVAPVAAPFAVEVSVAVSPDGALLGVET